jgi:hypothetical protein
VDKYTQPQNWDRGLTSTGEEPKKNAKDDTGSCGFHNLNDENQDGTEKRDCDNHVEDPKSVSNEVWNYPSDGAAPIQDRSGVERQSWTNSIFDVVQLNEEDREIHSQENEECPVSGVSLR